MKVVAAACECKVARSVTFGRTKATNIIKKVIGKCHFKDIAQRLRKTKFSVIIDELRDIGSIKNAGYLCQILR